MIEGIPQLLRQSTVAMHQAHHNLPPPAVLLCVISQPPFVLCVHDLVPGPEPLAPGKGLRLCILCPAAASL